MKTYIKIVLTALLIAITILSLFGCGSEKNNSPKMNIDYFKRADGSSYTIYNGDAQEFFGVEEGEENVVDVSVQKESGLLRILIHAENDPDTVIYDGHDFLTEHFTVTVKEPGRYRILVHAEDFIGSYKLSYGRSRVFCLCLHQ